MTVGDSHIIYVTFQSGQSNTHTHFTQHLARCAKWEHMQGWNVSQTLLLNCWCVQYHDAFREGMCCVIPQWLSGLNTLYSSRTSSLRWTVAVQNTNKHLRFHTWLNNMLHKLVCSEHFPSYLSETGRYTFLLWNKRGMCLVFTSAHHRFSHQVFVLP